MVLTLASSMASAQTATPAPSDVVSTAPAKAAAATVDSQIADWIRDAPPLGLTGPDDGVLRSQPDPGIHGEAGAFVSNHGYGGYVAATAPVGKNALVGVAVGDEHYSGRYVHGDSRSLAASLAVGPNVQRPAGCHGGVLVGDHYVPPVWVEQMRGAAASDDPDSCYAPPPANH